MKFWNKIKQTSFYKISRFVANSAAIGLAISLLIVVFQECEEHSRQEQVRTKLELITDNLKSVESSLSTRYLGIFPSYTQQVIELFENCSPNDTIIVFEDGLYYGFISSPVQFIKMNHFLLSHSDAGGSVAIAHYDTEKMIFHRVVTEELIDNSFFSSVEQERLQGIKGKMSFDQLRILDSTLCNKYFHLTIEKNPVSFESKAQRTFQNHLTQFCDGLNVMPDVVLLCEKIDSVRWSYLKEKSISQIGFYDYENMYRSVSREIANVYESHGINLIQLNEYLTMSCWMAGEKAVFAFPSKWSSDEIGFWSQDPAFMHYIATMLMGVRSTLR